MAHSATKPVLAGMSRNPQSATPGLKLTEQQRAYQSTERLAKPEPAYKLGRASETLPSDCYMPIKALNQFSTDWVIKARIVKKAEIKPWKNARGEGQLLNFDLVDKEGTLIQATCFNETAIKMNDLLQTDQVYTFCNGQVKLANKKFTAIKNDYCLTFDYSTVVEKCENDTHIKGDGFSFTGLAGIEQLIQNCTVDVIGVILDVGMVSSLTMKDGTQRDKRTLIVGDESKISISVTLWGSACEAHDYQIGQVIALKSCRVSEYNGKSLNASSDPNDISFNMRHPRAL